jgi:hypothetical protein
MIVTQHAVERYQERIDPRLTPAEARAAIQASARAVEVAARFGCRSVRQGCGAKLILVGDAVVTVLSRRSIAA